MKRIIVLLGLLLCLIAASASAELTVHFLDVGQGDAAVLLCDGQSLMIDGGDRSANQFVYSYLRDLGLSHLDYIISTHPHDDHVQGLATALVLCDVGMVYSPVTEDPGAGFADFTSKLHDRGVSITVPHRGDTFGLGRAMVTFLSEPKSGWSVNDASLVVKVTYGGVSFLFTGDAEFVAEADMVDSGLDLHADVLKVGHHGANTSTSAQFLSAVSPTYAIISVGAGNTFGHPAKETLTVLQRANIAVFRTDIHGTIIASTDGEGIAFQMTKSRTASPSTTNILTEDVGDGESDSRSMPDQGEEQAEYVGNRKSKKLHFRWCESVAEMKESNKIEFDSAEEAFELGYTPCQRCNPK